MASPLSSHLVAQVVTLLLLSITPSVTSQSFTLLTHWQKCPALGVQTPTPTLHVELVNSSSPLKVAVFEWQSRTSSGWSSSWTQTSSTVQVVYAGPALSSDSDYRWRINATFDTGPAAISDWGLVHTALLNAEADWKGATFLGTPARQNLMRVPFTLPTGAVLRHAYLYITGQSWFEVWVNGQQADPSRFYEPAQSVYQLRMLYSTYNITSLVMASLNILGLVIGNGTCSVTPNVTSVSSDQQLSSPAGTPWAASESAFLGGGLGGTKCGAPRGDSLCCCMCACCRKNPVLFMLRATYDDGSVVTVPSVVSNGVLVAHGPVLMDDLYDGETFDATAAAEIAIFSLPGFSPSNAWVPPTPMSNIRAPEDLVAQVRDAANA